MAAWAAICFPKCGFALWESFSAVLLLVGGLALVRIGMQVTSLKSDLEKTKFRLDCEVESGALLAKELELMLSAKQHKEQTTKEIKIGAFWNGSAAGTRMSAREEETKEEKEKRVAEYLEEVGGVVVSESDLRNWLKREHEDHGAATYGIEKLQRDIDNVHGLLSKALKGGRSKTEAIHEALFVLSSDTTTSFA